MTRTDVDRLAGDLDGIVSDRLTPHYKLVHHTTTDGPGFWEVRDVANDRHVGIFGRLVMACWYLDAQHRERRGLVGPELLRMVRETIAAEAEIAEGRKW